MNKEQEERAKKLGLIKEVGGKKVVQVGLQLAIDSGDVDAWLEIQERLRTPIDLDEYWTNIDQRWQK